FAAAYPALVDRLVVLGASPSSAFAIGAATWRPGGLAHVRAGEYDEGLPLLCAPQVVSEPGTRDLAENFIESARALPPAVIRNFFLVSDPGRNVEALLPTIGLAHTVRPSPPAPT